MCFSAPISFAASALLLPTGLSSLHTAYRHNPSDIPLASIPVAFAIQQACEGLVWLGIKRDSPTAILRTELGGNETISAHIVVGGVGFNQSWVKCKLCSEAF
jgi:hypothetical protein